MLSDAPSIKLEHHLASNYYSCLAPPPCQVEEQVITPSESITIEPGKGSIWFELPKIKSKNKSYKSQLERYHRAKANKQALKATRDTQYREIPWADMKIALEARKATDSNLSSVMAAATLASLRRAKRDKVPRKELVYVIDYDDDKMRCGVMNGSIPSAVADSGSSSNVGTKDNPCPRTGKPSNKVFIIHPAKRTNCSINRDGNISIHCTFTRASTHKN